MSTASQWLLLFRVHARMAGVKAVKSVKESRLMTGTILLFLLAYTVSAYWLFSEGLEYVARLPGAGALLSDRLIFVMFFCFMMMLVFSVAVTSYISLYRNRDTRWLLTLPVSHRTIFLWKCFESAMFSGWGLIFILFPLLLAFAQIRDVPISFFLKVIIVIIPFLIVASTLGSIILVTAVRFLSRRQILAATALVGLILVDSAIQTALINREVIQKEELSAAFTFQRVLHHTNISVNRALPSTWLSSAIVDWTRPYRHFGSLLYPTLLYSNALMGLMLVYQAGGAWFYRSWNRSLQHSAFSAIRRESYHNSVSVEKAFNKETTNPFLRAIIGRSHAAISRKDFLTFFRDPAQWVQFSLVFGLLAIYASGLRQMNGNIEMPKDLYLVAFLNLAVCALALSTLTTRFVFPQFSLEGRKLWILAMSPIQLSSLVFQKFVTSTIFSGVIIVLILLIGGYNLQLGWADSLFFAFAIGLLAIGLNALAVGLGVIFPNLEESNAAKIVSGFGGTLCLIGSFIYILLFILLLAWARWDVFQSNEISSQWLHNPRSQLAIAGALFITTVVSVVPLFFSQKKLKRLEIISIL
ncbi:MAG: hypothetical protein P1U58_01610 [Verrucomicrobiales bacterium]|nr:hypothetical protein [Verrucomicrobiales bacterium]